MADGYVVISKKLFEHIKSGGPCPLSDRLISEIQLDFNSLYHINQDNISPILVNIDEIYGTEEMVNNRRKVNTIHDYMLTASEYSKKWFTGGSRGDGFNMNTSDTDMMKILTTVVVTYPDQIHLIPCHSLQKTILSMREADRRPGYVTLEISQVTHGAGCTFMFQNAIVPFRDSLFLSSDIYRQGIVDMENVTNTTVAYVSNGPCCTKDDIDVATAFPCVCWPKEANEWIHRTRLHAWPTQTMIDRIVQDGCHLVPVGDKCSTDTLLQWRISFACAEQLLVHSLSHPQFRVYGLLKGFLAQIKDSLDHLIGDSDILCSYFLKTFIFYAVENTPSLFWHERNTFLCFRFCFSILIAWVKSGYCPNYFIRNNNMFLRKVHGENRQNLLHFLIDLYNLKLACLSVESDNSLSISEMLPNLQPLESRPTRELLRDEDLFVECSHLYCGFIGTIRCFRASLECLNEAASDVDEFIAYTSMANCLYYTACDLFYEYNTARSNKQKYIALKKCKELLTPQASLCTSPGLMVLATFHYLTGDYRKTLQMCADMMSSFRIFFHLHRNFHNRGREQYQRQYCGKGYTIRHKLKGVVFCVVFGRETIGMCPPHLHLDITKHGKCVYIPPLPYATFLSFLCYHGLGDIRRRDTELINLRAATYDPEQGISRYWIVHTLLGICYQTVGDSRRAIRSFTDSLRAMPERNAAVDRIEALRSYR